MHLNAGSTIKESQPDIPSSSGSKLTYATHATSSCIMQVSLARGVFTSRKVVEKLL
jgi:hypothetical protein